MIGSAGSPDLSPEVGKKNERAPARESREPTLRALKARALLYVRRNLHCLSLRAPLFFPLAEQMHNVS